MQKGSLKPDYTSSQARQTESPSNIQRTKIQSDRIILPGFLLKLNYVTNFVFLYSTRKRQICVKSELLANNVTHQWYGRLNTGNMIHHTLNTVDWIMLPQCCCRHAHRVEFLGTKNAICFFHLLCSISFELIYISSRSYEILFRSLYVG